MLASFALDHRDKPGDDKRVRRLINNGKPLNPLFPAPAREGVGEVGLKAYKKTLTPLFPVKAGIQQMYNAGRSPAFLLLNAGARRGKRKDNSFTENGGTRRT